MIMTKYCPFKSAPWHMISCKENCALSVNPAEDDDHICVFKVIAFELLDILRAIEKKKEGK